MFYFQTHTILMSVQSIQNGGTQNRILKEGVVHAITPEHYNTSKD